MVNATNGIKESLEKYNSYICAEILADQLEIKSDIDGGTEIEVNDNQLKVIVLKTG
jgi:isoleucyl-tRNA synthetase